MIKGVIFDIDDTLYSHKIKDVPALTYKALKKLKKAGYKLGICTSREVAEMAGMPSEMLDLFDCQIMSTGAVAMIKDKYYKCYKMADNDVEKYIAYFTDKKIPYAYSDINGDIYYWGHGELPKDTLLSMAKGHVFYKEYEDEEICNLMFYHASDEDFSYISSVNGKANISRWNNCGHVGGALIDKSFGVLKFCQLFSFTTDEVVAVGDGSNDDVMLQMAGIGIAVKNAKDNTKKVADYICKKSIEDGGLYQAFIDLGLIEDDKYEPKLFFFDIDSTSFDHSISDVRPSTYKAFEKLHEKGYKTCICTARDYDETRELPKRYTDSFDYAVYGSGTMIMQNGKPVIKMIDHQDAVEISHILDENNVTYRYATKDGKGFLNHPDSEKEAFFYRLYKMTPPIKPYEGEDVLTYIFYNTTDVRELMIKKFPHLEHINLSVCSELYPSGVNKGYGIREVAKMAGIDIKDTCAFGDSDNDRDMFNAAGLAIAMGNSTDGLKQLADYVTDDISEEGLYNALVHFKIIEED